MNYIFGTYLLQGVPPVSGHTCKCRSEFICAVCADGLAPCNDINEHFLWKVFSMMLANTYLVNLPCLGDPLLLKHPRRLFPALLLIWGHSLIIFWLSLWITALIFIFCFIWIFTLCNIIRWSSMWSRLRVLTWRKISRCLFNPRSVWCNSQDWPIIKLHFVVLTTRLFNNLAKQTSSHVALFSRIRVSNKQAKISWDALSNSYALWPVRGSIHILTLIHRKKMLILSRFEHQDGGVSGYFLLELQ